MSKKFIRFIHKFCDFVLVAAVLASVFYYPQWYEKQWHKIQGMYVVYQGDKLLKKGEWQAAINKYNEALEIYPEHYGAWFNLGNLYVAYEDFYSAIDSWGHAITLNPNYILARMNYGIISTEKLGNFDDAIEQYNKILEIRRRPAYIWFVLGNLKNFKKTIGLTYYNRGVAYHGKYMYSDDTIENRQRYLMNSIGSFKRALKIMPNDYDSTYNLALAYQLNGDYNLSGITYCKAIGIDPMNYEAHYNLALLLNHLKYYREALVEIHRANALLNSKNSSATQTKYLFDVMTDLTREVLKDDDGSRYLAEEFENDLNTDAKGLAYINGNFVDAEEFDTAMVERFRVCAGKKIFRDEENLDNSDFEDEDTPDLKKEPRVRGDKG